MNLYYRERGTGETLILLHGNGEESSYFEHQIEYFKSRYHVVALDTRGHGNSPRGNASFSLEQFSVDLYDFMQQHQIARATLLGFSDGANIAMLFAMKHPDMVKALILNGGNLDSAGVKRSVQWPIEMEYRIAKRFAGKSEKARKKMEMYGLMVNEPNIKPSELSRITMPALVICGEKDMIKESHTRTIARHLPNAKLSIIQGDHFIANKNPVAFNKEVEAFLQSVYRKSETKHKQI